MKKKFLTVLLIIALVLTAVIALSSCGGDAYNVTFNLKGGQVEDSTENIVLSTNKLTEKKVPAVTKEGYNLTGWHTTSDLSGDAVTFPYVPTAAVTLYAKWELKTGYAVYSFNVGGGAALTAVVSNSGLQTEPTTTKTGYTLEGWYPSSALTESEKITFPYTSQESITLYANWGEPNSYTITFDTDGGSIIEPLEQQYDTAVAEPSNPVKEDYAFGGWYTDEARTNPYTFDKMPAADTTLYAKWIGKSQGLVYELSNDGKYYILTGIGNNKDTAVYIPNEYEGKPVETIAAGAFNNVNHITSLHIPSSITLIERGALGGIRNLVTLTIPFIGRSVNSTTGIDLLFGYIFGDEENYYEYAGSVEVSQELPDGTSLTSYLPQTLTSVTITGSEVKLGEAAFRNIKNVTKIVFEGNIASNEIPDFAFESMIALTSIKFPSNITEIGVSAFEYCRKLIGISLSGLPIVSIGERAFKNCDTLTTVVIPKGVTTLSKGVFENCSKLESVTIESEGIITIIGERVFYNCFKLATFAADSLTDFNFTSIGKEAFAYCQLLTGFNYKGQESVNIVLPSTLEYLGESAFNFCESLTSITIEITEFSDIPAYAFANCRKLASVTYSINSSITKIGAHAFENCVALLSVTLKDFIEVIDESAFEGCTSLASFITKSTSVLKEIGDRAFYNCTALDKVVLPESLTDMGSDVFVNCKKLANSGKGIHFFSAATDEQTEDWNEDWNVITYEDEENEIERVEARLDYNYGN